MKFNTRWTWQTSDIKKIIALYKTLPSPIIHVCSGSSMFGDIRLDICYVDSRFRDGHKRWKEQYLGNPNILGDMNNLPFKSGVAGSVICDPPYDYDFTDETLINELVRICKPKGKILFISPWIPNNKNITVLNTELWKVGKNRPYFKIRTLFYKSNGQISDYA